MRHRSSRIAGASSEDGAGSDKRPTHHASKLQRPPRPSGPFKKVGPGLVVA
eukprot:m.368836 g.368836  ORF g.368836 m.368836 type:complete len:51 (+) comp16670_c0_seq3:1301-1453(+)